MTLGTALLGVGLIVLGWLRWGRLPPHHPRSIRHRCHRGCRHE